MSENIEVGDIVLVPCRVTSKSNMIFTMEEVVDCVLLGTHAKQVDYHRKQINFTVYQDSVFKAKEQYAG